MAGRNRPAVFLCGAGQQECYSALVVSLTSAAETSISSKRLSIDVLNIDY
jgi:hypothetical protein